MNYFQENFKIHFSPDERESLNDAVCRFREYDGNFNIVSSVIVDKLTTKGIRNKCLNFNISQIEFLLYLREYIPSYIWHKIYFRYQRYVQMVEKYKTKPL